MTKPLALVLYDKILPGSQLVNRLQDLGYRVSTVTTPEGLADFADQNKPLLVLADLVSTQGDVGAAIRQLKENTSTSHLPVIAFAGEKETALQEAARSAGATLVVNESAILTHLNQFLDQALQVE